ncbi:MAG: ABC transporter ATP-binding protein [bacterium]|nr:ABC transporter ATP-binding protein [bacterium]
MSLNEAILKVQNVEVLRGGVKVLDVPKLAIMRNEILSLIGPNGSGKSTLLLMLAGLQKTECGKIFFDGQDINEKTVSSDYRRRVTMVFQDPLLFDTTVYENVASGLKIHGLKTREIRLRVEEHLERFGILPLIRRSARKLSGGEAQRVSLARAFALKPEIIFLDEPFSSLDNPTKELLISDLECILGKTKTTAVLATHEQSEALRLADRLGVIKNGRIAQIGTPSEVINYPVDEFVASFVGTETILMGEVKEKEVGSFIVFVNGHKIEVAGEANLQDKVILCIRPENVTVAKGIASTNTSARNNFRGRINNINPAGVVHKLYIDCGFSLVAFVTNHSLKDLLLKIGDEVMVSFKATAVHAIIKK